MCREHQDEWIKLYCNDCKKALCQTCCIIYHRKCESFTLLESMIPEMRTVLEGKKKLVMKKIENEEKKLVNRKLRCSEAQQIKSSIQSQIQSAVQKAMAILKNKEKQLMEELDEIADNQMDILKADIKTGDVAVQFYKRQCEWIEQALSSGSEMAMYDIYQSGETGVVDDTREKDKGTRIHFSQDMDTITRTLAELQLGKFSVTQHHLSSALLSVLSETIDSRIPSDKMEPYLWDVLHMTAGNSDVLVVTDGYNRCVKSFYTRNKHHSMLRLKSGPMCIAKVDDDKLAVTLPLTSQIVTIAVTPKLKLLSTVKTGKQYTGLTALSLATLAASSLSPPCVDILDGKGNVLQSINPITNEQKILSDPYFLSTTKKGNIIVSDAGTDSVICLTPKGDVVFDYSPTGDGKLQSPSGITVTDAGDILVADCRGHKVIQLDEMGQFVRDILRSQDGVEYPHGLHYDERGKIYVTRFQLVTRKPYVDVFTFQ